VLQHERRPLHGSLVGTHEFTGPAHRCVPVSQMPSQQSPFAAQMSPPARQ
jgi:hypothetical protein